MAIDYFIDYKCYPKQELSPEGIMDRIKGQARADAVIDLFRRNGDTRSPSEMGFEFVRNTPQGAQETRVVYVQEMLDRAADLKPYELYCQGCPANNTGAPFGCMGQIEYPISGKAEIWLLNALPVPDETLPWIMLKQAFQEFKIDGTAVNPMRGEGQPFFQEQGVLARKLGELVANTNQLFHLMFLSGHLTPAYSSTLLLFFKAIDRNLEADSIMALAKSPEDAFERYPFLLKSEPEDDMSITQFKRFFRALYLAWGLGTPLILDV